MSPVPHLLPVYLLEEGVRTNVMSVVCLIPYFIEPSKAGRWISLEHELEEGSGFRAKVVLHWHWFFDQVSQ